VTWRIGRDEADAIRLKMRLDLAPVSSPFEFPCRDKRGGELVEVQDVFACSFFAPLESTVMLEPRQIILHDPSKVARPAAVFPADPSENRVDATHATASNAIGEP